MNVILVIEYHLNQTARDPEIVSDKACGCVFLRIYHVDPGLT